MKPLLHLDFHGKHHRKDADENWDIDVGCEASKAYWDDKDRPFFVYKMREHLGHNIDKIYEGIELKAANGTRKPRAEIDPFLHGFWGTDYHTMTSQSSIMGIPTFQFEMPPHVRSHLARNDEMLKKWAQIIVDLYQNLLVPQWIKKETPILYNPTWADKVQEQTFKKKEI